MNGIYLVVALCIGPWALAADSLKTRDPASPPAQDFYAKFSSIEDTQATVPKAENLKNQPAPTLEAETAQSGKKTQKKDD